MIANIFLENCQQRPREVFICDEKNALTYADTAELLTGILSFLKHSFAEKPPDKWYIYGKDSAFLATLLIAADFLGARVIVLNYQFNLAEILQIFGQLGDGVLFTDKDEKSWPIFRVVKFSELSAAVKPEISANTFIAGVLRRRKKGGEIVVLTSGTTGVPKAALYTWANLVSQHRKKEKVERDIWLLIYPLNHFAGVQILLHALINQCELIIPKTRGYHDVIESVKLHRVCSISATPTFWRMFLGHLTNHDRSQLALSQITLGGEPVTSEVLLNLRSAFPDAVITHVYATTEHGTCFSVQDGQPGFPSSYLERRVGNVEVKIFEGELFIKASKGMVTYLNSQNPKTFDAWMATGDLVEEVNGRVLFRGRKNEVINVGGVKVHPLKVEEIILRDKDILAAHVFGKSNPVTGAIVMAEVEIRPGSAADDVLAAVYEQCRLHLNRYEQPRDISVVSSIAKQNEKITRRS